MLAKLGMVTTRSPALLTGVLNNRMTTCRAIEGESVPVQGVGSC